MATKRENDPPSSGSQEELDEVEKRCMPQKKMREEEQCQVSDSPLGLYFSKVESIEEAYQQYKGVNIPDILSGVNIPSSRLGNLQESVQFNYGISVRWLIDQYPEGLKNLPLLLVYQESKSGIEGEARSYKNITLCPVNMSGYGTHHSKMMFLRYDNGVRIVISSANLKRDDWTNMTQSVWMSPLFSKLTPGADHDGDSETKFKADLIEYLSAYCPDPLQPHPLQRWIQQIRELNMSAASVFLIASVPGKHKGVKRSSFGHLKLREVLAKQGPRSNVVSNDWPCVAQYSSFGGFGKSPKNWLTEEFLTSMKTIKIVKADETLPAEPTEEQTPLKLVWPCREDVRKSFGSPSLAYTETKHKEHTWIRPYLHRWKSEEKGRTRALPHSKTFFRLSPDNEKVAWLYTGSHNLSFYAWGVLDQDDSQLDIQSYEVGVLFLPRQFGSEKTFAVSRGLRVEGDGNDGSYSIPLTVDVPLTPYSETDEPYFS